MMSFSCVVVFLGLSLAIGFGLGKIQCSFWAFVLVIKQITKSKVCSGNVSAAKQNYWFSEQYIFLFQQFVNPFSNSVEIVYIWYFDPIGI